MSFVFCHFLNLLILNLLYSMMVSIASWKSGSVYKECFCLMCAMDLALKIHLRRDLYSLSITVVIYNFLSLSYMPCFSLLFLPQSFQNFSLKHHLRVSFKERFPPLLCSFNSVVPYKLNCHCLFSLLECQSSYYCFGSIGVGWVLL